MAENWSMTEDLSEENSDCRKYGSSKTSFTGCQMVSDLRDVRIW